MVTDKILLGMGVVSIASTPIGLTRGGSKFATERTIREIEADGDRGPVKGRIVIDKEVAKLTVNALELFNSTDMKKYYPGLSVITTDPAEDVMTGNLAIIAGDYNDVTWTGFTKDGKAVTIKVTNALNMSNIEWNLEDKSEVVPSLEFTATYDEATRNTPPWNVKFGKGTTYSVTIKATSNGTLAIVGASIIFNGTTLIADATGTAVFTGVKIGNNQVLEVVAGNYITYSGSVNVVSANVIKTITMAAM